MKHLIIFVFAFWTIGLAATHYNINNMPNTDPDFTTLASAHAGANNGDTLYVCGSPNSYGSITISKSLTIIGTGYFLGENPYTQAYQYPSRMGSLLISSGASGAVITGMTLDNVTIGTNNITFKRNYVSSTYNNSSINGVSISSNVSNVNILQNYIYVAYSSDYTKNGIYLYGGNQNIFIANNIVLDDDGNYALYMVSSAYATVTNNVFRYSVCIYNADYQNNVQIGGSFNPMTNTTYSYNIGNGTQYGTTNGNISNVASSTIFTSTGSTDGSFQLRSGSPAIGTGAGGVDVGCFGGVNPYVLSGMPEGIPSIYSFSAPSTGFTIPVQLRIHSH